MRLAFFTVTLLIFALPAVLFRSPSSDSMPPAEDSLAAVREAASPATPAPARTGDPDVIPTFSGMVYVPPGEFTMGSADDVWADSDEFPQRRVFVDGFYMDINEVTNMEYKVFIDSTGREPPSKWDERNYPKGAERFPVAGITWDDAAAYAAFVGKRLPTEEEWEKAARGTDARRFPWGDGFDNKKANNGKRLKPIMSYPAGRSPYGLFDMAGNLAEWVDAWYGPYPSSESGVTDPSPRDAPGGERSAGEEKYKIYRGGSWNNFPKFLRCANREKARPGERWQYIGFRCAMDPPWRQNPKD